MWIRKLFFLLLLESLVEEALVKIMPAVSVSIVSTTQGPGGFNEELTDKINELEEKQKMYTTLNEMALIEMRAGITNSLTDLTNHFQTKLQEKLEQKAKLIRAEFDSNLRRIKVQINRRAPKNCKEVQMNGGNTNIYYIKPNPEAETFPVLCDMETRDGGWTYVMNRFDGSQNFNLSWTEYKKGFGNLTGEFWLGLEYLHYLTESEINELLIELVDWDGKIIYAHYKDFGIGNESSGYLLKILSRFSGDTEDSFGKHVGQKFWTLDRDTSSDCANSYGGGWWYLNCFFTYLTGPYKKRGPVDRVENFSGIFWIGYKYRYSMKQARMMVRPRDLGIPFVLPHKI